MTESDPIGYHYDSSAPSHTHTYLWPSVFRILSANGAAPGTPIFELGCGNGSFAAELERRGYPVVGVDASEEGVAIATSEHPTLRLQRGSAYDDLRAQYGSFRVVVSLEVIEHIYAPRQFARTVFSLLDPGGFAMISTPYHGYLKNVALAVTGRLDAHFTALWDHGHIKFWSMETLSTLLREAGFSEVEFVRVGRISAFAKSMIAIARKSHS